MKKDELMLPFIFDYIPEKGYDREEIKRAFTGKMSFDNILCLMRYFNNFIEHVSMGIEPDQLCEIVEVFFYESGRPVGSAGFGILFNVI